MHVAGDALFPHFADYFTPLFVVGAVYAEKVKVSA